MQAALRADRIIAPLVLFVSSYLATFALLVWLRLPFFQWNATASVVVATMLTIALWERGRWDLGLVVHPALALRELCFGALLAAALIGSADLLILLSTPTRRVWLGGFPWFEMAVLFVPAVLHEELLFRGYPFQKIRLRYRRTALLLVAAAFAALHLGNSGITALALLNIFLGGLLLGLAYETYERLWLPIGLHFAWNLLSGPLLGYEVSGYRPEATLFDTEARGGALLSGGAFGIEGSIWMTLAELVAIAMLARRRGGGPWPRGAGF